MLATVIDNQRAQMHQWSGSKKPPPEPLPRPGDAARKASRIDAVESKSSRWEARKKRRQEARARALLN